MSGITSYYAGAAAEDIVAKNYTQRGFSTKAKRWRNSSGEIDLIFEKNGALVFVEVKKSKDFETAAARISKSQIGRIYDAASSFLAGMPNGQNTEVRFDAALVNSAGGVKIIENAFGL